MQISWDNSVSKVIGYGLGRTGFNSWHNCVQIGSWANLFYPVGTGYSAWW